MRNSMIKTSNALVEYVLKTIKINYIMSERNHANFAIVVILLSCIFKIASSQSNLAKSLIGGAVFPVEDLHCIKII